MRSGLAEIGGVGHGGSFTAKVSNVEVTIRYHLMTHTLFLAILCLTTVFDDYLSIDSITYYRLSGDGDLVAMTNRPSALPLVFATYLVYIVRL